MERLELESVVGGGVYQPSVFLIKYKSPQPLEDVLGSEDEFVILHEYIHFLQDISTSFGCLNFCNYINRLQYGANQIYQHPHGTVHLPIGLSINPEIEKAKKVFDAIWGNTSGLNKKNGNALVKNDIFEVSGEKFPLYFIEKDSVKHIIGTKDVLENMAYIIERTVYGDKAPPEFFPYKTIEYVASMIAPGLAERPDLVCALCELSLSSTFPATLLVDNLRRIADSGRVPETIDDLVAFFENGLSFKAENGQILSNTTELNNYAFPLAKEFACKPFMTDEFLPLRHWATVVFDMAAECRREDAVFITRGLFSDNPRDYFLGDLISIIGCPTIMNFGLEPMTIDHGHNTNQVIYFHAVKELIDVIFSGKRSCGLYVGCLEECKTNNGAYVTSEDCYSAPWKRAREEKLCPLGKLFYLWGFGDREFEYSAKT